MLDGEPRCRMRTRGASWGLGVPAGEPRCWMGPRGAQGHSGCPPDALDHEGLLLGAHLDDEQRADLAEALEQRGGVGHGAGADGVGPGQRAAQLAQRVVLPVQQAEHGAHQLRALDEGLLRPVHHGLRDQLLQGACQRGGGWATPWGRLGQSRGDSMANTMGTAWPMPWDSMANAMGTAWPTPRGQHGQCLGTAWPTPRGQHGLQLGDSMANATGTAWPMPWDSMANALGMAWPTPWGQHGQRHGDSLVGSLGTSWP